MTKCFRVSAFVCMMSVAGCTPPVTKIDLGRLQSDLTEVRSGQAGHTAQMAALESQIRQLSGRVDELQHAQSNELREQVTELQETVLLMQRRLPPPAIVPLTALEEDEGRFGAGAEEDIRNFSDGLSGIRAGRFGEAMKLFEASAAGSGNREVVGLSGFWIGVAAEALGDYRKSLNAYYEFSEKFPKHSRTALVLLREAGVLNKLGDAKTAQLTLKKLVAEFPKSAEAERARERLKG